MAISIRCENPDCQKSLRVKDELAGKRLKCPACGRTLLVAAPSPAPQLNARSNDETSARSGHSGDGPAQRQATSSWGPWLAGGAVGVLVGSLLVGGLVFWWARSSLAQAKAEADSAKAELAKAKAEAASPNVNVDAAQPKPDDTPKTPPVATTPATPGNNIKAGVTGAVEAAMSGQIVKAAEYGTTDDEIFKVFKAKHVELAERLKSDPNGLKAYQSGSIALLRAMECVDPNRADTIAFRGLCRLNGLLPP